MNILEKKNKYKVFLVVVLLLVFLNIIGFSSFGQNILIKLINYPGSKTRNISTSLSNVGGDHNFIEKFDLIEKESRYLESKLARLHALEEENEKLRAYLDFFDKSSFDYIMADVIWQSNLLNLSTHNQNIAINKGSRDGLYEGLAVVDDSGVIVGKIISVNERSSQVCLINNNFCRMAVSVSNTDRSIGLAEGDLGLSIKVNFVPQNQKIEIDDRLITSGLERDIPRGLAVGRVNHIFQDESDIWQEINAEAFFNINNLNIVSVILPK
jgi:rod shape-determining protein MreC